MPVEKSNPPEMVRINTTLWEAIDLSVFFVKEALKDLLDTGEFSENSTAIKFLLHNLVQVILDPVVLATQMESLAKTSWIDSLLTINWALFGVTLFSGLACVIFLFLPMVFRLKKERKSAFALFNELPKSSCANEMARHTQELDKLEKLYKNQQRIKVESSGRDVFVDLVLIFLLSIILLVICALLANVGLIYDLNSEPNSLNGLLVETRYKQAVFQVNILAHESFEDEMVNESDWIKTEFASSRQMFLDASSQYSELVDSIEVGRIHTILFNRPCPGMEATCQGLLQLNKVMINKATSIFYGNDAEAIDELWSEVVALYITSSEWMDEIADLIADQDSHVGVVMSAIFYTAYGLAVALSLLSYLILRPQFRSLELQTMRGLQLLLSLPLSMLMSIDSIHQFLERGFSEYQESSTSLIKEHEQATKAILEGSQDAIIMVNEVLDVTFFNPAAEELTGYKAEDVLGKSLIPMLDLTTGKKLETAANKYLTVRKASKFSTKQFAWNSNNTSEAEGEMSTSIIRKDNTNVPVLISAISTTSSEGIQFAFFLKDIRHIKENQKQYDMLLHNILPDAIIETLRKNPEADVSAHYKSVTVFFGDIVEFTPKAAKLTPQSLVGMLNTLFCRWDVLCEEIGIEKIKTIGDCYMCACGVPVACEDHASKMLKFAIAALQSLHEFNQETHADEWPALQLRIGINTGPVVAGVIGKTKLQYDMWGDAVNIASRVESNGLPNTIQVSKTTYELVKDQFKFKSRGMITLKGKGEQECFILDENVIPKSGSIMIADSVPRTPTRAITSPNAVAVASLLRRTSLTQLSSARSSVRGSDSQGDALSAMVKGPVGGAGIAGTGGAGLAGTGGAAPPVASTIDDCDL